MPTRTNLLRAALLLAAVLLLSCRVAPSGKFIGLSVGSQPFRFVRSPHFTVRTEAIEGEAREIAIDLERSYRLLGDLGFPMEKDPDLQTDVILFRTQEDYERVGPKGSAGYYRTDFGWWGAWQPTFLSYGGIAPAARRRLLHELTHRFVRHVFPQAPIWLNEGLADYFETLKVEDGKAVMGRSPYVFKFGDDWREGIPLDALPTLEALFGMNGKAFYATWSVPDGAEGTDVEKEAQHKSTANYASSWAMVHVLRNGSPENAERLQKWFEKMAAGEPARQSFDAVFGDSALKDLEVEHRAFLETLANGKITLLRTDYDTKETPPDEMREMTPVEVTTMWGWAYLERGKKGIEEARTRAYEALEQDSSSPDAHLLMAATYKMEKDSRMAATEAQAAVDLSPKAEVPAYALFSIQAASPVDGARAQADKILESWLPRAKAYQTLNGFAWHMAMHGRAEEAVPLARRSIELNPSCDACFDTVAVALFKSGQYKQAIEAEELAAGLAGERSWAADFFERAELYKAVNTAIVLWKKRPEPGKDPSILPASVVYSIVAAQRSLVRDCYDLRKDASATGGVMVAAEIGKDGKVTGARALPESEWGTRPEKPSGPPLSDEAVTACVVDQLAGTRFPESSAPTKIAAPYMFALPPKK